MKEWQSLAHVKWECKYHIVFVPKYRKKVLYGRTRKRIGPVLCPLCRQKGGEIMEGQAMPDHIHWVLRIPPKFSVALVVGSLKGKSAIQVHREALGVKKGFTGKHFWSRGDCVSTVGLDEATVRAYVRHQEELDQQESLDFDN